jgi:hypothetical protein
MADPFDIFEVEAQDAVRWIGAAATLTDAHAVIRSRALGSSGRYMIVNQRTGQRMLVNRG